MRITFQYRIFLLATMVAGSFLFGGCKKDKVPIVKPIELTKWEKLSGNYKVYDTLGIYLYDMSIAHIYNNLNNADSLYFQNLDDNFNFGRQQPYSIAMYNNFFQFGHHELLFDNQNNRVLLVIV